MNVISEHQDNPTYHLTLAVAYKSKGWIGNIGHMGYFEPLWREALNWFDEHENQ